MRRDSPEPEHAVLINDQWQQRGDGSRPGPQGPESRHVVELIRREDRREDHGGLAGARSTFAGPLGCSLQGAKQQATCRCGPAPPHASRRAKVGCRLPGRPTVLCARFASHCTICTPLHASLSPFFPRSRDEREGGGASATVRGGRVRQASTRREKPGRRATRLPSANKRRSRAGVAGEKPRQRVQCMHTCCCTVYGTPSSYR